MTMTICGDHLPAELDRMAAVLWAYQSAIHTIARAAGVDTDGKVMAVTVNQICEKLTKYDVAPLAHFALTSLHQIARAAGVTYNGGISPIAVSEIKAKLEGKRPARVGVVSMIDNEDAWEWANERDEEARINEYEMWGPEGRP